ncbi:MAG: hypothetical protein ACI93R_000755 [Flavobacteriales bacterium]|jgi:hypothetical protein
MSIQKFFFKGGLTQAVIWGVYVRLFLSHGNEKLVDLVKLETRIQDGLGDEKLLCATLDTITPKHTLAIAQTWWGYVAAAIFGCLTMIGSCNYSGNEPVNLWVILGAFCLLPMSMVFASLIMSLKRASLGGNSFGFLGSIIGAPLLRSLNFQRSEVRINLSHYRSFSAFLLVKIQIMALVFQSAAIATFFLVVLFQDVAFAWSSTVIHGSDWMVSLLQGLAWPWHRVVDVPSESFILASQFYRGGGQIAAEQLGQWWLYLLLAMLVYGLIPRLLLVFFLAYRLKRSLLQEVISSGELDQFIRIVRSAVIKPSELDSNAKAHSDLSQVSGLDLRKDAHAYTNTATDPDNRHVFDRKHYEYVAWQCSVCDLLPAELISDIATDTGIDGVPKSSSEYNVLGLASWATDLKWLHNNVAHWEKPSIILVERQQTPTAELADIVAIIRKLQPQLELTLVVLDSVSTVPSKHKDAQFRSWQLFAKTIHLTILLAVSQAVSESTRGGNNV